MPKGWGKNCFSHGKWLQHDIESKMKNYLYSCQPLQSIKTVKISQPLHVTFLLQDSSNLEIQNG
jgi:hypothetical protein